MLAIQAPLRAGPRRLDACYGPKGILKDLERLVGSVDRFAYEPDAFESSLASINRKLFGR